MKNLNNFSQFEINNEQAVQTIGGGRITRVRRRAYGGSSFGTQVETAVSEDEFATVMTAEDSTASTITYCRAIPTRTRG